MTEPSVTSDDAKELREHVATVRTSVALLSQAMEIHSKAMEQLSNELKALAGPDGRITALEKLRWMGAGMVVLLATVGGVVGWLISVAGGLFHSGPPAPPPTH